MSKNKTIFEKQKQYIKTGETLSIDFRKEKLKKLKSKIKELEIDIEQALKKDLGKAAFESYATEIGQVYDEINVQLKNCKKWSKAEHRITPLVHFPAASKIVREPYGVVLIIGPFNYPFQLNILPLVAAISAGNCVMIKPSEHTPETNKVIKKLISEIFDEKYVYVIEPDDGKAVVQEVMAFGYDYVFFTGSVTTGKIIMKMASENLTPVTLELGGKSPCIVDEDCNMKLAAKRIVWGKLLNAGQTCVAPDYLCVHKKIKDEFLELLVKEIIAQFGEDPENNGDYTRMINSSTVNRMKEYISEGDVYYGGKTNVDKLFVEPTILMNAKESAKVMNEEIFGPVLPVVVFENLDSLINDINNKPKPLAIYYFSESGKKIKKVIKNTSSGGITINDTVIHAASSKLPFGGVGNSGMGVYHGKDGFYTFTHKKGVIKRGTFMELPVKFAPYKDFSMKLLKMLLK